MPAEVSFHAFSFQSIADKIEGVSAPKTFGWEDGQTKIGGVAFPQKTRSSQ